MFCPSSSNGLIPGKILTKIGFISRNTLALGVFDDN